MTRVQLSSRRPAVTVRVQWGFTGGPDHVLLVTFGFDGTHENLGKIREAFVASFRAESTFVALANDGCILYSRALQHGDTIGELASTMSGEGDGPPASVLGAIARTAVEVQNIVDNNLEFRLPIKGGSWQENVRKAALEAVREVLQEVESDASPKSTDSVVIDNRRTPDA